MKHTAALSSFVESINEDLKTNEKQLTATQGKLARLQHRQNQLRAQLEHVSDSDSLQDNSCPACYANSRNDQQLQQEEGRLKCPACNWVHVEIPQEPQAVPQSF